MSSRPNHSLVMQNGSGEFSLEEIARHFGVTKERIRQIESLAMKKLHHLLRDDKTVIDTIFELNTPSPYACSVGSLLHEYQEDFGVCEAENINVVLVQFDNIHNVNHK